MLEAKPKSMNEVYDLLAACGYPALPERGEALDNLKDAAHITLCDGDTLVGWIGVYGNKKECALDVAVLPQYRKKWATPNLVRGVFGSIFARGVEKIKVETSQNHVVKAAIKIGFKMSVSDPLLTNGIALELKREDYLRKATMRGRTI
jgi:predicted GNAT family N-acyltransferase